MMKTTWQRIDIEFAEHIMKIYPDARSIREATENLNNELEKILYGKK